MGVPKTISRLILLILAGIGPAVAYDANAVLPIETILSRMAAARAQNRTHLRPYRVTRNYRLFAAARGTEAGKEGQTPRSEVIADVSFVPPNLKRFAIQRAEGMRLGERIVRQMLEHETAIVENYGATDLTAANYDFRVLREEELAGQRCLVLEMLPRRKDKTLLRGQIWVDATTFQLRRTEGEPGKAPSWWFRASSIVLVYGDVSGMWLQTSSESTADVRFVGRHVMVSRDLEYKMNDLVAKSESHLQPIR